ncbi:GntR family transcriptional regulator [Nocardiopsis salina]|uniref:GntR family transcriptional regulator n=1 Tax=Nocardiopsis salina TaxID=245836 RepID=UPI000347AA8F|nr:GntR family transcriptional regulator [Nocardiopsis salina]
MKNPKPTRQRERHNVYRRVREKIIGLDFSPGSAISENELAAALGVSRTPVREAMLLLTEEGLVEVFAKIGTFVSRVDPEQVAEAQFLREAVELASLRSLSTPLDEEKVDRLRDNLRRQKETGEDIRSFFALDEEFHRGLMDLAGHESSWSTVSAAKSHLDRARMLGIRKIPELGRLTEEHHAIFDAAVSGDAATAERHLRSHLRLVFADVKAVEEDSPELFVRDRDAGPHRRSAFVWD